MKIPHLSNLETPPLSQENIGHWDPDVVIVYLGMTTGTVLESENTEIKMRNTVEFSASLFTFIILRVSSQVAKL